MYSLTTLLAILILLIIVNIIAAIALFRVNKRRKEENEKLIAGWQQKNNYMDHTLEFCEKANKLTEMVRLSIQNSDSQSAEQCCLDECTQLLERMHGGSSEQEALILEKKNRCESLGICFIDEIRALPENGTIRETDIISLMGNLLDNAIEACAACMPEGKPSGGESLPLKDSRIPEESCSHGKREPAEYSSNSGHTDNIEEDKHIETAGTPFIRVESTIRKKVWCFTVVNSKNPDIILKEGSMPTTKDDARNHGLGIGIVKSIVSRYNGSLKMDDLGITFKADVQLFTKKTSHRRR